jgi:hypothetical protein
LLPFLELGLGVEESGESSLESPEALAIVNHDKQSVYRAERTVEVVANKNVDFRGSAGFFEPMTSHASTRPRDAPKTRGIHTNPWNLHPDYSAINIS